MAEEGDEGPRYTLEVKGEILESSKNFTGAGKAGFLNGDSYDGAFNEGKRSGKGTYTWASNGDVYAGGYEDNARSGLGKYTFSSKNAGEEDGADGDGGPARGGVYHGQWANGKRDGQGTFAYVNGDSYSGNWAEGQKNGQGTYVYSSDGAQLSGRWAKGWMVSGKWTLPNGAHFVGNFKWNHPIGEGVWVFPNGNQIVGTFTQVEDREGQEEPVEDEDGNVPEQGPPNAVAVSWASGDAVAVHG